MKNKRGLIGAIILSIFLLFAIIIGVIYFQIKTHGLTISTGNVVINIDYNESLNSQDDNEETNTSINSEQAINATELAINITEIAITEENNSIVNQTQ